MVEQSNRYMIYTPIKHIPIGEAVKRDDGTHALRIKNPKTKKIDEVTLDYLFQEVIPTTTEGICRDPQAVGSRNR